MVMTNSPNLNAVPSQQIVSGSQVVSGQNSQGNATANSVSATCIAPGQVQVSMCSASINHQHSKTIHLHCYYVKAI